MIEKLAEQDWFLEGVTDGKGGWLVFVKGLKYPVTVDELTELVNSNYFEEN